MTLAISMVYLLSVGALTMFLVASLLRDIRKLRAALEAHHRIRQDGFGGSTIIGGSYAGMDAAYVSSPLCKQTEEALR